MKITLMTLLSGIVSLGWSTCQKKAETPPIYTGPPVSANLSIRQLRNMHYTGGFEKIMEDYIIGGIVIANDSSDNFYKTIVIQDSTGGITVRMDGTGLYSLYPVGRRVFIRLKELWLGDYSRMVQLGAGVDRADPQYPELIPIPQPLFSRHVAGGNYRNIVQPIPVTLDQLNDSLQSCLVHIQDVELPSTDTGKTYADAINKTSASRTVVSCSGARASLRTSGFASFAGIKTPRGNGAITAVYSVFRSEKQLMIRDTSDIRFTGLRCSTTGPKLLHSENFEKKAADSLKAGSWRTFAEAGGKVFRQVVSGTGGYAEINAFAAGQSPVIAWLVSPALNLANSSDEQLRFETRDGFDNGAVLQVLLSTNYDGGNAPWKAKWTPLKATIAKGSVNTLAVSWTASGNVNLGSTTGTVYLAFRYEGGDPVTVFDKRTTTFQVDNIRVLGN